METSNYNFTDSQKESCAVSLMRDTVEALSLRDNISYEEALLRFTSSKIYSALFDTYSLIISLIKLSASTTLLTFFSLESQIVT